MTAMKSVAEIRLINLEILLKEAGTADALAERCGLSPVYISQIRSRAIDRKTGKPRNLGAQAARKLEEGMERPSGWMDRDSGAASDNAPWPFKALSPERYALLPERVQGLIEGRALAIAEEWEQSNRKSPTPGEVAA